MKYLEAIVGWVKRHALWLVLLAGGTWTGAALMRRRNNAVNTLGSARAVEHAKARIKALQTERASIVAVDQKKANELLRVHSQIEQHKKAIAEVYNGKPWAELSDAEVQAAMRAAGI